MTEKDNSKHRIKSNSGSLANSHSVPENRFETNSDKNKKGMQLDTKAFNSGKISSMLDKQNPQPA